MATNMQIYLFGFLSNAIIWRVESGNTEDIIYPVLLIGCNLILLGAGYIEKRGNLS